MAEIYASDAKSSYIGRVILPVKQYLATSTNYFNEDTYYYDLGFSKDFSQSM